MGVKRMEALELAEVLGSLLGSVVEAQAQAARATWAFVDEVGFETTEDGARMRTVRLRYRKQDENGEPAEFEVEVPLLAMVNIPALAVKEAKLSFSYDVVATESGKQGATAEGAGAGTVSGKLAKVTGARMRGYVRRTPAGGTEDGKTPTRSTTAIDLDVTLAQQEMPIGVERLFDLAELGITEQPAKD